MMITGRRGYSSRMRASRSRPLAPGIRISEMITSGCWRLRRLSTPSALSKLWVVMPSCCRAFSRTQRMERSSSTIQTVSLRLMTCSLFQRQGDREKGVARVALTLDQALMLTDDVLGNRQAQTGAVGTTADHGVEDGVLQFGG